MLENLQIVLYTAFGVTRMPEKRYAREGYLRENYHYFHLKDSAGQERDFHFHDFDKLVLLLSGRVEYLVESERYELRPGTVLLVRHHAIHKALIDQSEPYERIILYLDRQYFDRTMPEARLLDCFDQADRSGQWLLEPDEAQRREIRETLAAYERAAADKRYGAQAMCDTWIIQLLVQIGRLNAAQRRSEKSVDPKIREVLSYINENLSRELSVEELAGNMIQHGFTDGKPHCIEVRVLKKPSGYYVRFRNDCLIFDPVKQIRLLSEEDPTYHIGLRMISGIAKDIRYTCVLKLNNIFVRL